MEKFIHHHKLQGGRWVVSCEERMLQDKDPRQVPFQDPLVLGGGIL